MSDPSFYEPDGWSQVLCQDCTIDCVIYEKQGVYLCGTCREANLESEIEEARDGRADS